MKTVLVVCAWCDKLMNIKRSTLGGISHGICKDCAEKAMKEIEESSKQKGGNDAEN